MRIFILSVGKQQDATFKAALDLYVQRISHFTQMTWLFLTPFNKKDQASNRREEADAILRAIPKDSYVVLLDERGKIWSSHDVANQLERRQSSGQDLVFIIGGAYGVDKRVFEVSNEVWSLSKLVFPHQLVRIILAEQLYRGFCIRNNLPYHHQ
jgi:23S rRNA (pseudouridine1915-N3)-methyltransferase